MLAWEFGLDKTETFPTWSCLCVEKMKQSKACPSEEHDQPPAFYVYIVYLQFYGHLPSKQILIFLSTFTCIVSILL